MMIKLNFNWRIRLFFLIYIVILMIFIKTPYGFLVLNTFLGYIPIELSFQLQRIDRGHSLFFYSYS